MEGWHDDAATDERVDHAEARRELTSYAESGFGNVPSTVIANHLVDVAADAGWRGLEAAFEALERRVHSAYRDRLRVRSRPIGGQPFGVYAVAPKGGLVRPYAILLESVAPLRGSCDCRDYLRNSLGLCKHLLTVLEDVARRTRAWARALQGRPEDIVNRAAPLRWNPARDLSGDGDPLAQLRWIEAESPMSRTRPALAVARRAFMSGASPRPDGERLKSTFAGDPRARRKLIEELQAAANPQRDTTMIADPAVTALLEREHDGAQRRAELLDRSRSLTRQLKKLRIPLYRYQRDGVKRFLASGRLLLADDMGLGKTVQAIACGHSLYRGRFIERGLIVVPAPLKRQWAGEWRNFSTTPIEIVEGPPAERRALYERTERGFLILNYELLLRDLHLVRAWDPEFVVLDEAQRIKNRETKTARVVKQLQPKYRLVLTGTPMENRLEELVSIVEWIDDMALEPKWRLVPWHTVKADENCRQPSGARNLDTLRARLAPIFLRRRRDEVLEQLPPRTDSLLPVDLTPAQQVAHYEFEIPTAQLLRQARKRPLRPAEFLRLMQLMTAQRIISNGMAQFNFEEVWPEIKDRAPTLRRLRALDSPKILALRDLLDELLGQGQKVVIFSQWRRALRLAHWAVQDVLAAQGAVARFFTGREGATRRTENIVDFHDEPDVRVLFASDAGGTGLNLQRAAACVVNLELPWNPATLEQRIGRIYRLGQTRPIQVFNLVGQGSIEGRIAALVGNKKALFDGLFDGASDEIAFEHSADFMTRLCQVVGDTTEERLEADVPELGADSDGANGQTSPVEAIAESTDSARTDSPEPNSHGEAALRRDSDEPEAAPLGSAAREAREPLSGVTLEKLDDGTVRLEAQADAAEELEALFMGLAGLVRRTRQGAG